MKFQLTDYQTDAVADVINALGEAVVRFQRSSRLSAVALSAPTGAGKTVVATAVVERLLYGDETMEPVPDLTVLWVTDDPSLNQQTKRKMLLASSQIAAGQLVTVDQTLDQEVLDPGKVYFVHIQQLGRGATNYVKTGDNRQWSIWETIGNTIRTRGAAFLLIIDEAHKGTSSRAAGSQTITAQLIDGAGGSFPPAPVVLGISATPERFVDAIARAGQRTLEPIVVDPAAVRESGLVKDKIRIKHPAESQPGDSTLLQMAVEDLKSYDSLWSKYSAEQGEPLVKPALVIQVKAKASDSDLAHILETLEASWHELRGTAIAHCLQEHTALNIQERSVRYISPQDIQDDSQVRVVLFKEALTTGWDCPRAEVMLSFRSAQDHTYIAQLIGRMVRTPLARRIATDEYLNTVALYLPYYDEQQVADVVAGIQSDEGQIASQVEVDAIMCPRNSNAPPEIWGILDKTPTYTRPARNHRNEVARLNSLAMLLVGTGLHPTAIAEAKNHIVTTLAGQATRLDEELQSRIADLEQLDYRTQTVELASGAVSTERASVFLNARNIEDVFRRARRILGDAAAKWYWDTLYAAELDPDLAKIQVAALASIPAVPQSLEAAAKELIDEFRTSHIAAINRLPEAQRVGFYTIWQQARAPQQVAMIMPTQITSSAVGTPFPLHIYADAQGNFPTAFSGWEAEVLHAELQKQTLVGWYRNPIGGTAALGVPYDESGRARTLYPDFLMFHQDEGGFVIDIVDPHRPDLADTAPKWRGLAEYAGRHGSFFRRIVAVIKDAQGSLVCLDLKDHNVATRLTTAATEADIRSIFGDLGSPY